MLFKSKEQLQEICKDFEQVLSTAYEDAYIELVPKDLNDNCILTFDKFIAWKYIDKENTRYGLRGTVEVHSDDTEIKFYIMLFEQDIEGDGENMTDVFSCSLDNENLLANAHTAIKGTGVMFDTKNYCESLSSFLNILSNTNPIFTQHKAKYALA